MRVKYLLVAMFILFTAGVLVSSSHAEIAPETIVGAWPFDEGKDATAGDSSGNGHNGTLINDPKWVDGKVGEALEFNGTNGVEIPHSDELTLSTFSIAAWIKLETGGAWQQVVSKPSRNYSVGISPADLVECAFKDGGWKSALSTTTVVDGQWHHVAGTYDMKVLRIYVDGVLEGETACTDTPSVNTNPVEIGRVSNGGTEAILKGIIDEVIIFNTALAEDEINTIMKGTTAVEPQVKLATAWGKVKATH